MTGERLRQEEPFDMSKLEGSVTDEQSKADYYRDRMSDAKEGKPTWVARNFDADFGRVYDFYRNGLLLGTVEHDWEVSGGNPNVPGCFAYIVGNREATEDQQPLTVQEAVKLAEEY